MPNILKAENIKQKSYSTENKKYRKYTTHKNTEKIMKQRKI